MLVLATTMFFSNISNSSCLRGVAIWNVLYFSKVADNSWHGNFLNIYPVIYADIRNLISVFVRKKIPAV